ncbi:hypothetical protein [Mycobacterium lepromatosis]|uniref:hypothetical protein n=1 Tax=Mycobacterium lepromatosis TaxID=480418 RepID=UPI0015846933|nr:hypothetical protein [Mycobacterium lepromatosis]
MEIDHIRMPGACPPGDVLARHAHKSPDHAVDGFYLPSAVDPHKKSSTALG